MASDVIESESELKGEMSLNNGTPDVVTPKRTGVEHRHTSSPSSSGVSAEGDEEELEESQNREETFPMTKKSDSSQERTTPNNEQTQAEARSSTPVSLPQPRSPPGPIGR